MIRELKGKKELKLNVVLNEIFVQFYEWIEKGVKLDHTEITKLFQLLFAGDRRFIRYCPENIEEDIFVLEDILKDFSDEDKKTSLTFILSCINVYAFDSIIEKKKSLELDILYYKAAISQYYIEHILNKEDLTNFNVFKKEFFQIGTLINNFYKCRTDMEKNSIILMLKSKTLDLFKRYEFKYSLPICTA